MPDGQDTSLTPPTAAKTLIALRVLSPGQRCEVWIASAATGGRELAFATDELLLEAPK